MRLFATAILFGLTGCSSVVDAKRHKNVQLESLKKAYVVRDPNSTHGCEEAAHEALTQRGVTVTYGFFQEKPKDVDFYVVVLDHWQWDVAMFLSSLDISFKDNATDDLIATGWFKQSTFFHTFPDQRMKTFEIIDAIYRGKLDAK